jgi:hypothetical protein
MVSTTKRPHQVTIDGVGYAVAELGEYSRSTVAPQRAQVDQGSQSGEGSLTNAGLWRRGQRDFSGGAGQIDYDAPDSVPSRFFSSIGVNPFNPGQLAPFQLMSARATVASVPVGTASFLHFIAGRLVWVLGANLRYSSTTELLAPTLTTNALTSAVVDCCTDGQTLYYAYASGGGGSAVSSTSFVKNDWAASAAQSATWRMLDWAGRLFGGDASGNLSEILPALTTTTVYAHPRGAAFSWGGVVASPAGFYAYGHSLTDASTTIGNNYTAELYRFTVDPSTGALTKPVIVASFPGERILCMAFVGDIAFIGTNRGFRCAQVNASTGAVQYGPLVRFNGLTNYNGVPACAVDGRFVVFSWGQMSCSGVIGWGVGRADLSNFTRPLVPAYCAAEASSAYDALAYAPASIAMVYGWPYFVTGNGIGAEGDYTYPPGGSGGRNPAAVVGSYTNTLYGPDDARTLFDNARLVTSAYTWGVADPRTPTHIDVVLASFGAGEVAIGVGPDRANVAVGGYVQQAQGTGGPALLAETQRVSQRQTHVLIGFRSGASAPQSAPVVQSVALYASINPARVEEIILPLSLGDDVDTRAGGHRAASQTAVYQALKAIEASGRLVDYTEGDQSVIARIDGVQLIPASYDDRQEWWTGTLKVRLVTADLSGSLALLQTSSAPNAGSAVSPIPPAPSAGVS